jgi:hypothetical protein
MTFSRRERGHGGGGLTIHRPDEPTIPARDDRTTPARDYPTAARDDPTTARDDPTTHACP